MIQIPLAQLFGEECLKRVWYMRAYGASERIIYQTLTAKLLAS